MPDNHNQAMHSSSCSDGSTDEGFQRQSTAVWPSETKSNSLEFAEDVKNKSKERCHNPTQSLQLLSCGAGALKKQAPDYEDYLYSQDFNALLHVVVLSYLHSLVFGNTSERTAPSKKKLPQEHDFIINNYVRGSDEKCNVCCDGEGDSKTNASNPKNSQYSSRPSVNSNTGTKLQLQKQNNGDGDEDDDDENRNRKRKSAMVPNCSESQQEADNDEEEDGDNSTGKVNDADENDVPASEDGCHSDHDVSNENALPASEDGCCPDHYDGDENALCATEDGCHSDHDVNDENALPASEDGCSPDHYDGDENALPASEDGCHSNRDNANGLPATEDGCHSDHDVSNENALPASEDGCCPDHYDGDENALCATEDGCHSDHDVSNENALPASEDGCHPDHYNGDENALPASEDGCHSNRDNANGLPATEDGCHLDHYDGDENILPATEDGHHIDHDDADENAFLAGNAGPSSISCHLEHRNDDGNTGSVTGSGCHSHCDDVDENGGPANDDDLDDGVKPASDANDGHIELIDHPHIGDASSPSKPITQYEIDELIREVSLQSSSIRLATGWPPDSSLASSSINRVKRGLPSCSYSEPSHQSAHCAESLGLERPSVSTILHSFDENYLGIKNGRYDEGFEWRKVREESEEDKAYLGGGTNGKCYLITDLKTNKLLAIKKIPLRRFDPSELKIWSLLSGHNIRCLDLFGAVHVDQFVTIFMEYMEEGSVAQLLDHQDSGCLDESICRHILREVIEAVKFLHSLCIIHCDIKGENVFLNSTLTRVKLGDYGSAIQLPQGLECIKLQAMNGTEYFMSPEACRSEEISFSADIWSCAGLAIQMLTGKPLFYGFVGSVLYKVGSLQQPPPLPDCSHGMKTMLTDMFAPKPSQRPSAKELLSNYPILSEANCQVPIQMAGEDIGEQLAPLSAQHLNNMAEHNEEFKPANCHVAVESIDVIPSKTCMDIAKHGEEHDVPSVYRGDDELHQLQSDLIRSLSLDGANVSDYLRMVNNTDETVISDEEDGADEANSQFFNHAASYTSDGTSGSTLGTSMYSIKDLTKVIFYNNKNELLFEVREKASCTVGHLVKKLHDQIKEKDIDLESFAVTSVDDTQLDVDHKIGHTWFSVILHPVGDDNWHEKWKWRVDSAGQIQCYDRVMA